MAPSAEAPGSPHAEPLYTGARAVADPTRHARIIILQLLSNMSKARMCERPLVFVCSCRKEEAPRAPQCADTPGSLRTAPGLRHTTMPSFAWRQSNPGEMLRQSVSPASLLLFYLPLRPCSHSDFAPGVELP